jgi:splicing factor 3B subunit 3
MGDDVACLDIAPVPEGRARCRFLAVGCFDSTVRVLGMDPEDGLKGLALQVCVCVCVRLCVCVHVHMCVAGSGLENCPRGLTLQVCVCVLGVT